MTNTFLPGTVRDRIADLMKYYKVSQTDLALKIGCGDSLLSRFLTGKTDKLGDENIIRIARAFNVSTDFLLGITNVPDKKNYAIDELGLYLVTHAQDQEALQLYWSYIKLAQEGREKYQKMYGPLLQTDLTPEEGYAWLKDPWPWDEGGND